MTRLIRSAEEFARDHQEDMRAEVRIAYEGVDDADWADLPVEVVFAWNQTLGELDRPAAAASGQAEPRVVGSG